MTYSSNTDNSISIRDETEFQRFIGYELELFPKDGTATCALDIDARFANRSGFVHGAIVTMLLDNACGGSCSATVDPTGKQPFVTLSLTVNFIAPAICKRLVAKGKVVGGGKSTLFAEAQLFDENDQLIATATGPFKRAPQREMRLDHS
ncbi:Thioesterase superfamily protein [Pseudovibrio sp. W64]|uniref:PaaI family thioesterase n=1 Tax=Pseudovibrio sp. W64 TaxID=1735583 RepID=UPI0007AEC4A6|nr:PaaI family thioesterase [Pseudovibrio sp. W64]KZK78364.1 Thioesterase superfamily protein [Pseudovibrio sp. W64]